MAFARPETVANELAQLIARSVQTIIAYESIESFNLKRFLSLADKLERVAPFDASRARAMIFHLAGDREASERWLRNCLNWVNNQAQTVEAYTVILSNLGFFTEAAAWLAQLEPTDQGVAYANVSLACGSFSELLAIDSPQQSKRDPEWAGSVAVARRCVMAMDRFGVTQQQLRSVLDLAGEVLRAHKLFFAGEAPVIHTGPDGILYEWRVKVDAARAAELTNEVLLKLIDDDMDASVLSFSFIPA